MPATEKELKFDFSDPSRTDSQKWKMYAKELSYLVMNTHGPLGSLADVRTITLNEDSPGDNLWGFTDLQPFTEQFNSPNEKTFLALKDKWFKIQMLVYSNLDSSFLTSDTELVNKYSYTAVRARIEQYVTSKSDSDDPVSDDYAALLVQFVPFGSFLLYHLDKNTVWTKPLMLFQCSLRMTSLAILSKMALKQNFKNGVTRRIMISMIQSGPY